MDRTSDPTQPEPGQSRPPTMKDIAVSAGVAQSTVSRILSGSPLAIAVAPSTRERVEQVAQAMGYRPNPAARALRGAKTMLLGVIIPDVADPFFFTVALQAVTLAARARGYNVVLGLADSSTTSGEGREVASVLEARHCDALIVLGDVNAQPRLVEDLRASRVRLVGIWQHTLLDDVYAVNADNSAGIRQAVKHLRKLGHQRIAFISSAPGRDVGEREETYRSLVPGMPGGFVQHVPNTPAGGVAALRKLLALDDRPTAIVAATDLVALGVLHEAYEADLHIPRDLSLIGFDDIPVAAYAVPALTTLRMPTSAMVDAAVSLATAERVPEMGKPRLFRPKLVVRSSTGPVPPPQD